MGVAFRKTCNKCGKEFSAIPADAKFAPPAEYGILAGFYWNCVCHDTLFVPASEVSRG